MIILIGLCVDNYKETVYTNQDLIANVTQIPIFHKMSKNQALLLYKDSKKMGNTEHDVKFKTILEKNISDIYKEWKDSLEKRIKIIEKEKEKSRLDLERKHQLELRRKENEKKLQEEILRQERIKAEKEIQSQRAERNRALEEEKMKIAEENRKHEKRLSKYFSMMQL